MYLSRAVQLCSVRSIFPPPFPHLPFFFFASPFLYRVNCSLWMQCWRLPFVRLVCMLFLGAFAKYNKITLCIQWHDDEEKWGK